VDLEDLDALHADLEQELTQLEREIQGAPLVEPDVLERFHGRLSALRARIARFRQARQSPGDSVRGGAALP
jgi:hypothetical protein